MGVKSVIDIDINDEEFRRFHGLFEKYQTALSKQPAQWAKVNKQTEDLRTGFEAIIAAMLTQSELSKKRIKSEDEEEKKLSRFERIWHRISDHSKSITRNVTEMAKSVLRWTALGTITTGLVGAGSLFGLDRLAGAVAASRRNALGIGTTVGEQRAFGATFGRFVNPDAFLGGIGEALINPALRPYLGAIGLTGQEQKGTTGQVAVRALQRLKGLVDRTPMDQLALLLQSTGAGNLGLSEQDLRRLRSIPRSELDAQVKSFGPRSQALQFDEKTMRAWTDFLNQLEIAGQKIESAFVKGLDPLIKSGVLDKLSDGFANAVQTFASSPQLQKWMNQLSDGLGSFADYISSSKFQKDVQTFAEDVGIIASAVAMLARNVVWMASWFGGAGDAARNRFNNPPAARSTRPLFPNSPLLRQQSFNNPGNLRVPGSTTRFQRFGSEAEGIQAIAKQLLLYEDRDKLNTIRQIISKYAPSNENDTSSYIRNVVTRTGFAADQTLNLHDKSVMAALVSAITKQEGRSSKLSPQVVIKILDQTGGNVNVSTAQLAAPR